MKILKDIVCKLLSLSGTTSSNELEISALEESIVDIFVYIQKLGIKIILIYLAGK